MRTPRLPFRVVHEDRDILVIDKPAGLLTSTVPREKPPDGAGGGAAIRVGCRSTRESRVDTPAGSRRGRAARLLEESSGVCLPETAVFQTHGREDLSGGRERCATPRSGTIDTRLTERADGSVYSIKRPGGGERAITHYETISQGKGTSLLRVKLETGKKHQIRVHLAERGVPIVNDPMYGRDKPAGRLMLIAAELTIDTRAADEGRRSKLNCRGSFEVARWPAGR